MLIKFHLLFLWVLISIFLIWFCWFHSRPVSLVDWDYRWMPFPSEAHYVKHPDDQSVATYRGHSVLRTLIRCYFSPVHRSGRNSWYFYLCRQRTGIFLWTAFKRLHLLVESWPLTWVDCGVCNIILLDSWHNCNLDTSMQIRIVSQIKITHLKQLPVMSFFHSSLVSQSWIIQQKPWCLLLVAPL